MKIYLLDINHEITKAWQHYFSGIKDVIIVNDLFDNFMKTHNVQCIVSPGNSRGIMSGGYDLAITKYFGLELTYNVQKYIIKNYKGLQPVGSAFTINIPNSNQKLIHCPTMQEPSIITNTKIVKDCMIAVLQEAKRSNIHSIVIPAFGGLTGNVEPNILAKLMYEGYKQSKI